MFRPITFLLALVLATPIAALAQAAPPAPAPVPPAAARAPHHANRYMAALHALTLTPDQQQQIAAFFDGAKTANAGADKSTRHANARKLRAQIAAVLTPDQRAQLRAAMKATAAPAPQ